MKISLQTQRTVLQSVRGLSFIIFIALIYSSQHASVGNICQIPSVNRVQSEHGGVIITKKFLFPEDAPPTERQPTPVGKQENTN